MNWTQFRGDLKQVGGKFKQHWAKLTDDDLMTFDGQLEQLAGRIQERYGIAKEEAQRQLDQFTKEHAAGSDTTRGPTSGSTGRERERTEGSK